MNAREIYAGATATILPAAGAAKAARHGTDGTLDRLLFKTNHLNVAGEPASTVRRTKRSGDMPC